MRSFCMLLVASVLVLSVGAACQEISKVEIFGGYSLLHIDTMGFNNMSFNGPGGPGTVNVQNHFHGWNAAAQWNVNNWLGITADFSGHYGEPVTVSGTLPSGTTLPSASLHNFLFGPTLSYRTEHLKPFVHTLFGVNRLHTTSFTVPVAAGVAVQGLRTAVVATGSGTVPEFTDNAFAMAIGGGVDYRLTKRFTVRMGQLDYLYTKHNAGSAGDHQNNFRFSTGLGVTF
jgi:opacity protein-like surface antigen